MTSLFAFEIDRWNNGTPVRVGSRGWSTHTRGFVDATFVMAKGPFGQHTWREPSRTEERPFAFLPDYGGLPLAETLGSTGVDQALDQCCPTRECNEIDYWPDGADIGIGMLAVH